MLMYEFVAEQWASIVMTLTAGFVGWQALLTRRLIRLQRTPLVTLVAEGLDDLAPCVVWNVGPGAALSVVVFQPGTHPSVRSIGDLPAGGERKVNPPIIIKRVEKHPCCIYYRDSSLAWYATRVVRRGFGLFAEPQRRRVWRLPPAIRHQVQARTVVEELEELNSAIRRPRGFWTYFKFWGNRES